MSTVNRLRVVGYEYVAARRAERIEVYMIGHRSTKEAYECLPIKQ